MDGELPKFDESILCLSRTEVVRPVKTMLRHAFKLRDFCMENGIICCNDALTKEVHYNAYLVIGKMKLLLLWQGMAGLDTGSLEGMLCSSQFVETVQSLQDVYVSCIKEIAWRRGFINTEQMKQLGKSLKMTANRQYLLSIAENGKA